MTRTPVSSILKGSLALACLLGLGCGGGKGSGELVPLLPGTYQLSVSLVPGASAQTPMGGGEFAIALPEGFNVAVLDAGTGELADTALQAGSALPAGSLLLGRYQASSRQVKVTFTAAPAATWSGECCRIRLTLNRVGVYRHDLMDANKTLAGFRVVGLDTQAHDTLALTSQVQATLNLQPGS